MISLRIQRQHSPQGTVKVKLQPHDEHGWQLTVQRTGHVTITEYFRMYRDARSAYDRESASAKLRWQA